jgi:putative membrane protein
MDEHGLGLLPLLGLLLVGYLIAVASVLRRRQWPWWRTTLWCAGLITAAFAVAGPPVGGRHDFVAHMVSHLLIGMLAPLLLVVAAPVTLILRALPVRQARRLSWLLARRPVRGLMHPITAAVINLTGLWLLWTTELYPAMNDNQALHAAVHGHLLVTGYLLTAAIVGVDPASHRPSFITRTVVLVAFLAAHAVLAKYLYVHPPPGVARDEARIAGMVMYYGGDLVDLVLVTVFCRQWYVAARPRTASTGRGTVRIRG